MSSHCADRQACTQRETDACCQNGCFTWMLLLTSTAACPDTPQTAITRLKAANSSPLLLTGPRITSANTALPAKQQVASAAHPLHSVAHAFTVQVLIAVRGVLARACKPC